MGFVKMPEMLSPEIIKALAGNLYTANDEVSHPAEMAAARKEYIKEDKKHDKKDDKWDDKKDYKKHEEKDDKKHDKKDDECCCPEKVKFIFLLNNTAVINVNAVCEEDD